MWVAERPPALKTWGGEEVGCGQNSVFSRLAGTTVSTTTQRARLSEDEGHRRGSPGLSFAPVSWHETATAFTDRFAASRGPLAPRPKHLRHHLP